MDMKLIGGTLLIIGTSIGAGILALPVSVAPGGFVSSTILLFFCWLLMAFCAFVLLEVNLALPSDSNIISMAKTTLGPIGQGIAWVTYLLLSYSLICAYIASGSDVLHNLFNLAGINIPVGLSNGIFTFALGSVVYHGIRSIDYVNRGFMVVKMLAYLLLVLAIFPYVSPQRLTGGEIKALAPTLTVMITSFGFSPIIPSLRSYFNNDIKKLRLAIFCGSLIPLICYIAWDLVILGTIPTTGTHGLISMLHSGHSTSALTMGLSKELNNNYIASLARLFTAICTVTSSLGVALCLMDFLADGFHIKRHSGRGKLTLVLGTMLPPFIIVLLYPTIFIKSLNYAGIFCIVLVILLPIFMVWQKRYNHKIPTAYRVKGGKIALILAMLCGLSLVIIDLMM